MTGKRIFLVGATGTAGRGTLDALQADGHEVVAFVRARAALDVETRVGDIGDPDSLMREGLRGEPFDAVVSCLASRTGAPRDAWAVDHAAQMNLLRAAQQAGIPKFVLLSAICVQKPLLAFQHAKLAFEQELMCSGLEWSIVRPTAFFKSLSGQIDRVRAGKPFLVFGDGTLTACKPISDADLGRYISQCVDRDGRANRILAIGGPGPAITPLDQARALFDLLDRPVHIRHVPVSMIDMIHGGLRALGTVSPRLADKAELARIGRYYATESMLVWDAVQGRYDAAATPETGTDTLFAHYADLIARDQSAERGDHAVF